MTIIVCQTPKDDNNSKTLVELRKKLPPCPICGKKAYLLHDVIDGADYGYSVGCGSFHNEDGVHRVNASFHNYDTKEEAFEKWLYFCKTIKGNNNDKHD